MNLPRLLGRGLLWLCLPSLGLAWQVGDKLEIQWSSAWYPGKVIAVEGERIKVSYDGYGSAWDEWTTAARLHPLAAPAPPAPAPSVPAATTHAPVVSATPPPAAPAQHAFPAHPPGAETGLEGAWLRTESFFFGTSLSLTNHVWFFTANGRVARAPSGGFDPAAFAEAKATPHRNAGVYRIEGDKLVVNWAGIEKPTTLPFAKLPDGGLKIGGIGCTRVRPFTNGWRVAGRFEGGASGGGSATSRSLTFRADGTFTRSSVASVSSTSRESVVSAGAQSQNDGTYAFDGFTLRLTAADGSIKTHTVAAFGAADPEGRPEYLYLDGGMLAYKQP
ncbi:MAG: hypothetical protein MUE42_07790 [Opitutaceae bacterium]|nr:hypothetical protein [Opitutaceae bacterium]